MNWPLTCDGNPLTVRLTAELNPKIEVALAVRFPHCPAGTARGLDDTVNPKSGGGIPETTSPTITLREIIGSKELPVIVKL
jgi:hypothetical protein